MAHNLTAEQRAHLVRVLGSNDHLIAAKYVAGQLEHGGECWTKPGMLAHGLDEVADLAVYLWTVREQLLALADKCDQFGGMLWVADEIRRIVHK